jgi:hypothetical protein
MCVLGYPTKLEANVSFNSSSLPDPQGYFEGEGLFLKDLGKWRTTACAFHGGSDSMRINTQSGAWVYMNCGVKSGDVLAHHMQAHGLEFVEAAKVLGAWQDDGKPQVHTKPATQSPRAALEVIAFELPVMLVVAIDIANNITPKIEDLRRFKAATARLGFIVGEVIT